MSFKTRSSRFLCLAFHPRRVKIGNASGAVTSFVGAVQVLTGGCLAQAAVGWRPEPPNQNNWQQHCQTLDARCFASRFRRSCLIRAPQDGPRLLRGEHVHLWLPRFIGGWAQYKAISRWVGWPIGRKSKAGSRGSWFPSPSGLKGGD